MNEKQRLLNMLHEKKISETEFKVLLAALEKEPTHLMKFLYFLANPFHKITGIQAVLIGIVVVLLTSYLGFLGNQYYINPLQTVDASINAHPRVAYSFWLVLYQNVICCLILSLLYFTFAKIFQKKSLRSIDFLGMVAVARFPILVNAIVVLAVQKFWPNFIAARYVHLHFSWLDMFFTFQNLIIGLWLLILYFNAQKVASGLTGSKLWISVIGTFILTCVIGSELTMFFV